LVWRLELDVEKVLPDYFVHALSGPLGRTLVSSAASGTSRSMQQISKTRFGQVPFQLPSIHDQQLYVDRCEAARGVVRAASSHAEALRDLRANLLTVLLSGEHQIPESYDAVIDELVSVRA
jgi:type I restriction enzyme, S subunit